jgi:hypothetical protein
VQLVRIDSDNGSIFFVKTANMDDVLTVQRIHIVVKFIPGVSLATWQLAVGIQQNLTKKSMQRAWAQERLR